MLSPDDIASLLANAPPRNTGSSVPDIFDAPDPSGLDSSGMDLSCLGLGGASAHAYGMGALNPNQAPQGQHANVELPGKLTAAKAADAKLSSLIQSISGALTQNQSLLLSSPKTAGLVSVAQNAIADLQGAQSELEGSFWSGSNFNTFQGSTDAWNLMDQATSAALQKLSTYSQLATQLAGGVATAQADANAQAQADARAASQAQAAAASQASTQAAAANTVNAALATAQVAAANGDFSGAVATLGDPAVTSAATVAGMTAQVSGAISNYGRQKTQADRDAATATQNAAASQAAQAAAANAASAQAAANAATTQAGFDLQKFQAQLAADAAQHAADAAAADAADKRAYDEARQARQDQLDKLQLILTAAPVLGKDVVAAAVVNELGLDASTAGSIADQSNAGLALDGSSGADMRGAPNNGFFPETAF